LSQLYVTAETESTSATLVCDCLAHRFGNAADNGVRERRYPTDMTAREWAVVRPLPLRHHPRPGRRRPRHAPGPHDVRLRIGRALERPRRTALAPLLHLPPPRDRQARRSFATCLPGSRPGVLRQSRRIPTTRSGPLPRRHPSRRPGRRRQPAPGLGNAGPADRRHPGRCRRGIHTRPDHRRPGPHLRLRAPARHPAHPQCRLRRRLAADGARRRRLHRQVRHQGRRDSDRRSRPPPQSSSPSWRTSTSPTTHDS
jgi:hypothetical protein